MSKCLIITEPCGATEIPISLQNNVDVLKETTTKVSPRSSPQSGASAAALRFSDHGPPLRQMTGGAERTLSPVQQPQEPTERQRRGAPQRFYGRCPFWLFRPLLMTWTAHPADGRRNLAEGCETSTRSGDVTSGFPLTGRAWTLQETEQGRKPPSVFWSSLEGSRRPEFPSQSPQLAPLVPEQEEERRLRRLLAPDPKWPRGCIRVLQGGGLPSACSEQALVRRRAFDSGRGVVGKASACEIVRHLPGSLPAGNIHCWPCTWSQLVPVPGHSSSLWSYSSTLAHRAARGLHTDPIGFVFDVQSNTVMAQGGSYENMKEKINAVRSVVPNKSNNEIILVLQHFDNCVDRTVQAFMEGNAVEVLKEWTVLGKKKNKKKKTKPKAEPAPATNAVEPGKAASAELEKNAASSDKSGLNGYHINGSTHDTESVDSLSEGLDTLSLDARELEDSEPTTPVVANHSASTFQNGRPDLDLKLSAPRVPQNRQQKAAPSDYRHSKARSGSVSSSQSLSSSLAEDVQLSSGSRKLGANIEKSVKDLQRCSVSLARYRIVVKEEMDASIKKMKQTFSELQSW
ncbi:unnamed protein product [Ranitomeya imitator]|uniref:Spermatogenesis-associated serine-rich protein 2 n=1 Tax=Ranitomeya imitator TaxID=111125 RepID=A0ABN9MFL1_9NEOB|nr:unnamed protein product [Ranitomeya imitator]